jgi:hypothetical protein
MPRKKPDSSQTSAPTIRPEDTKITRAKSGATATGCAGPDCRQVLQPDTDCYRDEHTGRLHCIACGQILRYHRKKALERGETLPVTMAEVNARFERLRNNVQSH